MISLKYLLVFAIIVGAGLYILRLLPLDETFKKIVWVVAIVGFAIYALLYLMSLAGVT